MKLTADEARTSLEMIELVSRQARRYFTASGGAYYLILWGAIWFLGNLSSQFLPAQAGWVWMILDTIGIVVSIGIGFRLGARVRSPMGNRIGLMWLTTLVYGALIVWASRPADTNQANLLFSLVIMLGYIMTGFWLERRLLWVGLFVTIAALVGYLMLPAYFSLWMAIFGGGVLFASGLIFLRRWS